jgi:hypothetical protein
MKKRGKILRDTAAGPGLIAADGQQYPFSLEGTWRSEEVPRVGMAVEMEIDDRDSVVAVTALPESQLAREQAEAAMAVARERGAALASGAVARFGVPALVAAAALVVGWTMLAAVSVAVPFGGNIHVTFWGVLGLLNSGNFATLATGSAPSAGIYGLLAAVAIAGPFLHYFWKDRRAALAGLLPLVFMLLIALLVRNSLHGLLGGGGDGGMMQEFADRAREEAMKAVSIGSGVYVSLVAALYFAFVSARRYMAAGAAAPVGYAPPEKLRV